ncbi:MAG TPA: glycosyltransferase family 4 protein [Thermodesulfobacteriota bacterium]|nr:glycosyltransferase family 4 protein [Thermodesulfobacteriota bacterium]
MSDMQSQLLGKKFSNRLLGLPMKRLYMKAHKIISPSYSTVELLERGGIPREQTEVIYNGVNSDMLSRKPNTEALEKLRNKFNIQSDEKVILTLARLVPRKGQDNVIKALPKVIKGYDKVKYLVVGEGRYEEDFKSLADREGARSKIIFAGSVPHSEVIHFYDLCDLFIMPNRTIKEKENIEGLPNVVLEAASRGKPVITGIPGGAKEAIQHGRSGYIVNGENIDEIATCILDLLKDDEKAREFGIQGRQRIQEMFTEEKMIEGYLRVLGSSQ